MAAAKPNPGPTVVDISDQIFKRFDANKDGKITVGELSAVQKEVHLNDAKFKAEFAKLDANHDGALSIAELGAGLKLLDINHDGHVSATEAQYVLAPLVGAAVSLLSVGHH